MKFLQSLLGGSGKGNRHFEFIKAAHRGAVRNAERMKQQQGYQNVPPAELKAREDEAALQRQAEKRILPGGDLFEPAEIITGRDHQRLMEERKQPGGDLFEPAAKVEESTEKKMYDNNPWSNSVELHNKENPAANARLYATDADRDINTLTARGGTARLIPENTMTKTQMDQDKAKSGLTGEMDYHQQATTAARDGGML